MADANRHDFQDGMERLRRDAAAVRHAALRSRDLGRIKEQIERQRQEALSKRDQEEKAKMNNGTFDKDEFWAALGRLYNDTLELKASIAEQRTLADRNLESIAQLRGETSDLLRIASIHQQSLVDDRELLKQHEKRLDRTEVTVEAILEDLRRHRENRPPA